MIIGGELLELYFSLLEDISTVLVMQEHRKYQVSVEQAQRILEHMINCLKIFLKLMRQILMKPFMKERLCILYWTLSDLLSSVVDNRHLI
jgi:hypothetical protein